MKNTRESLSENFSSSQYLSTLDFFIFNAVKSLIDETRWVDVWSAKMLAWSQVNFRRKVSHLEKKDLPTKVLRFLLAPKEHRLEAFKEIRFDRTVMREMILTFLRITEPIVVSNLDAAGQYRVAQKVAYSGDNLYGLRAEILHWFEKFNQLKAMILEKYTRHVINAARATYVASNHALSLDDIMQDFLLVAIKAVERCDSMSGTLTSFTDNWLVAARHSVFTKVKEHNKLVSLEDNVEDQDPEPAKTLDVDWIRQLARSADPEGMARFSFGLEESLPAIDKTFLRLFSSAQH